MRIRFLVASLALIAAIAVAPSAAADVPVCSLPDKSFAEGDGGIFIPSFKADCTALVPHDLLFHLRTADGTAVAPADYQAIDFDAGPNGQELEVVVVIVGDTDVEPDETFTLTVSDPSGRVSFAKPTATITIVDDDAPPSGPCILLSDAAASVSGVASTPAVRGIAGTDRMTVTNCGDTDVHLDARGTDATGDGATWQLTNASSGGPIDSTCDLGLNLFRATVVLWLGSGGGVGTSLTTQDTPLLDTDGDGIFTLPAMATQEFSPEVELPCDGSDNLGDPMTMTIDLTAVAP